MDKDTRKVLKAAERQGYTWRIDGHGHPVVYRDGKYVARTSGTASDVRSIRNFIAVLRRDGFIWPPKR